MSHPQLLALFESWSAHWAGDCHSQAALDELRDHALSIYEAELDDGATPDEALAIVLEECSEAEVLRIHRGETYQRRVRWTMRWTTAALVSGVLITGSIAIWWPGKTAPPLAVNVLQAQQPEQGGGIPGLPGGAPPGINITAGVDSTEQNNAVTQKKLATYITAEFMDAPLSEVLKRVGDDIEVETYINVKLLADAGVTMDVPVTITLKRVRADMLIELALQQAGAGGIDYVVRDGIVVITTTESLEGASEVKAYPVSDLLKLHGARNAAGAGMPGGLVAPGGATPPQGFIPGSGSHGPAGGGGMGGGFDVRQMSGNMPENVEQLINVISSTVAPDTWQTSGGFGTITYYGDMLIIRQNARTHREVDKLLKLLRDTAAKKP